ncbi:MAG: hypothetical protein HPY66_0052 [Firmicutes bacterium]|nr:hypothetical protein [Bacillota bacterium]MDI6706871.1 CAP domain-containing protein [Bacillota bacterium]
MNKKAISIMVAAMLIVLATMPTALAYSGQYSAFQIANNLFGIGKYFSGFKSIVINSTENRTYVQPEQAKNTTQGTVQQAPSTTQNSAPVQPVSRGGSNASRQAELTFANQGQSASSENNVVNAPGLSAQEKEMIQYINEERVKAGVKPLQVDTELSKGARMKSQDMVDNGYFAHNSPTYGSPFDMMNSLGIKYRAAGENIARNSSVLKAHVSLMNSEGHRKNILNPNYTHVGVGIVSNSSMGGITVTQWFITK